MTCLNLVRISSIWCLGCSSRRADSKTVFTFAVARKMAELSLLARCGFWVSFLFFLQYSAAQRLNEIFQRAIALKLDQGGPIRRQLWSAKLILARFQGSNAGNLTFLTNIDQCCPRFGQFFIILLSKNVFERPFIKGKNKSRARFKALWKPHRSIEKHFGVKKSLNFL